MHWCNAISLCHISSPHSLTMLGRRLKSNSGMEPPPLTLTSDTAPVKSKVEKQLTVLQGVDYCSTASTVNPCDHQERDCHHTVCHLSVDTLHIVITTQIPLHLASLGGLSKRIVSRSYVYSAGLQILTLHTIACFS